MKKIIIAAFFFLPLLSLAQNEKYMKTMEEKVSLLDTTWSPETFRDLANTFERIGTAEKTQWLPYYYAALANVNLGYSMMSMNGQSAPDAAKIDPLADKAEEMINKAEALSKDNSEIFVVKKMIASLRMMVDPMSRWMKYGPVAQEALETAKRLNAENPRTFLLEGQDKFYTPEQFGGSKTEAKKLFETALAKFDTFKPESSIHPRWGKRTTEYFLKQAN
jgi:hypothetical protein